MGEGPVVPTVGGEALIRLVLPVGLESNGIRVPGARHVPGGWQMPSSCGLVRSPRPGPPGLRRSDHFEEVARAEPRFSGRPVGSRFRHRPHAEADQKPELADHRRLPGKVIGARTLGGAVTIHTRNDNGPQACDDDRFYFVHAGQVYEITIMRTGKEDWSMYDRFLDSFHF